MLKNLIKLAIDAFHYEMISKTSFTIMMWILFCFQNLRQLHLIQKSMRFITSHIFYVLAVIFC